MLVAVTLCCLLASAFAETPATLEEILAESIELVRPFLNQGDNVLDRLPAFIQQSADLNVAADNNELENVEEQLNGLKSAARAVSGVPQSEIRAITREIQALKSAVNDAANAFGVVERFTKEGMRNALLDAVELITQSQNALLAMGVTRLPVNGDVRLVGEGSDIRGRVEVWHDGDWRHVCNDEFDYYAAKVVCNNQLGIAGHGRALRQYGAPEGSVLLLDDLNCRGDEATLLDCPTEKELYPTSCGVNSAVGVQCGIPDEEFEFSIRLVTDGVANEGRVEAFNSGAWGVVCSQGFYSDAAKVACRELGFAGRGQYLGNYGGGVGQIVVQVSKCEGNEQHLKYCNNTGLYSDSCTHAEAVGLRCETSGRCPAGNIGGYDNCSLCPVGWYQDQEGQDECIQCPPGYTTASPGTTYHTGCIPE